MWDEFKEKCPLTEGCAVDISYVKASDSFQGHSDKQNRHCSSVRLVISQATHTHTHTGADK